MDECLLFSSSNSKGIFDGKAAFDGIEFKIKHKPLKRLFDIAFSFSFLVLSLPLFLLIALAIRCTSQGCVFFAHERIGRGGRPFKCYKFRTMYTDAEERLKELLAKDASLKAEWEASYKLKKDPRLAPFGRFLRKSSLDELPQFWNVLKGDLSVVGPRPVIHEEVVKHLGGKAAKILSFRPGITCIWQVSGRSDIVYPDRLKLDEKYIDNYSLLLDLSLIIKTIPSLISSKGAY